MARKRRESFNKYVRRFADWLRYHYFLGEYKLHFEFHDKADKHSPNCAMSITTDDVYLRLVLNVYPLARDHYKAGRYWSVAEMLVHEFAHPLIHPVWMLHPNTAQNRMTPVQWDIYERQTQRLTNVVMRSLKKSDWMPK